MLFRTALLALALVWPVSALSQEGRKATPELQTVEIVTKSGVRAFAVEMAITDAELDRGLMFRTELPEGRGMLFDFKRDRPVTMWMKDTPLSLDMIFIRSDGTIVRIAENTTPMSIQTYGSGRPARAVLEVVAGTARKFGIATGDRVRHPMFQGK